MIRLWFVVRKHLEVDPDDGSTYWKTVWHKYIATVGQAETNDMREAYFRLCDETDLYEPEFIAEIDPEDVDDVVNALRDGLGRFMTGERFDGSESIDRELDEVWE